MKACDLIALLQMLPPETDVTIWCDGETHQIHSTDTIDHAPEINSAQINALNSYSFAGDTP
jgi:hypothetical protein